MIVKAHLAFPVAYLRGTWVVGDSSGRSRGGGGVADPGAKRRRSRGRRRSLPWVVVGRGVGCGWWTLLEKGGWWWLIVCEVRSGLEWCVAVCRVGVESWTVEAEFRAALKCK
uniref:Uncharacterized protein n=1 Tax=Cannabis sativa TaxID=3483 RepID=A0A803Q1R1_CANSA